MSSAKSSTATAGPHAAFAPPGFDRPLLAQRSIRGGPTVRLQPGEVTAVNWRSAERTTAAQPTSQEAHQRLRGPVPTARALKPLALGRLTSARHATGRAVCSIWSTLQALGAWRLSPSKHPENKTSF